VLLRLANINKPDALSKNIFEDLQALGFFSVVMVWATDDAPRGTMRGSEEVIIPIYRKPFQMSAFSRDITLSPLHRPPPDKPAVILSQGVQ